jgi:hypothetical protein
MRGAAWVLSPHARGDNAFRALPHLIQVKHRRLCRAHKAAMWQPVTTAPEQVNLEVAVLDEQGEHVLAFPCRRDGLTWIDPSNGRHLHIDPTHWRIWIELDDIPEFELPQ